MRAHFGVVDAAVSILEREELDGARVHKKQILEDQNAYIRYAPVPLQVAKIGIAVVSDMLCLLCI